MLALYKKLYPNHTVQCCAPTGRAARRMEESTGVEAATIHRALKLMAGEDGVYSEPEPLDADLVLVDEASMLDIYLAENLFRSLKPGCQVVLVGDADQLPSVGPGRSCGNCFGLRPNPRGAPDQNLPPKRGSPIAINAALIRAGNLHLEYGPDFEFIEARI
ncbi:MAG: AAA family ATPase [Acutalibacter sp.]